MTEKIIIDGVNVAGCRHLSFVEEDYCCDCQYEKYASCDGYDCAYKQLKRLEQERDELKEELGTKEIQLANAEFDLHFEEMKTRELEQENNALQAYKDINEDFKKAWDELNEKHKQLRSALEEIKHILEIHKDELEECLHNDIDGMIQNKINEVLS